MNVTMGSYYSVNGMNLAINIYNFPEDYKNRPDIKTRALRYLFMHRKKDRLAPALDKLETYTISLFEEFNRDNNFIQYTREIADIIAEFIPRRRTEIFERLRDMDDIHIIENKRIEIDNKNTQDIKTKLTRTVYSDSQNVHNTSINESVIKVLENLFDMYKNIIVLRDSDPETQFEHKRNIVHDIENVLVSKYPDKKDLISSTTMYIIENTALFGKRQISMLDGYISLWLYITEHEFKTELESRLLEEMKEMKKQCTTGHIARFMNVIQGFTADEKLNIKISNREQCYAVITHYLNSELAKCDDEDMILEMSEGTEKFVKYIRQIVSKKILEWKRDYGEDMIPEITRIINNFAKTTIFKS